MAQQICPPSAQKGLSVMRLTAATVRALALPPDVPEKTFFDDDLAGFGVRVRAGGSRNWIVQYKFGAKHRRMVLGSVTALDPGKARATAKDLLAAARLGQDPAGKRIEARAQTAQTFGALLPRYLAHQKKRLKPRSYQEVERHLLAHAKPLHSRPIANIDRSTIAIRLSEIAEANGPTTANRVRASLSASFAWLLREGVLENNPVLNTNKAVENGPRERTPTDDELTVIYRAAGDDQYGAIVRLLMLLGMRRDEVGGLRRSEIDLEAATITLPAERTKNRREHIIPLSEPALQILSAQPHRVDADGISRDLIFGYGKGRGYQDWSGSKADLDARIASAGNPLDPWTPHDFRRSLSTALHERFKVAPHVVETILGHAGGHLGGIAGVYNRAIYLDERRRALDLWAQHHGVD